MNTNVSHGKHTYTLEYSKITTYIYLGSSACCGIHFNTLKKLGIIADIDLETRKEEGGKPKGAEIFLWIPTPDFHAPTQKKLEIGAEFLQKFVRSKVKTYVHCRLGHGRSPTLVAAYFIREGMSAKKAIAYIKKKRPEVHLFPPQKRALDLFEKKWKKI